MAMVKFSLRKKDYNIPMGQHTIKRRKIRRNVGGSYGYRYRMRDTQEGTYEATTEFIEDNDRLSKRRGDIVKFYDGKHIRKILRGEFAVVLDRYKKTRHKSGEYVDYYAVVMLITGPHKGEVFIRNTMNSGFSKIINF